MASYLVADVGATNGRFGCVRNEDSFTQIAHWKVFANDDFAGLFELITQYRSQVAGEIITGGCLAIAGPVSADAVQMTNRDWSFSIEDLRRRLGFAHLEIINDFAGLAYSLPHLPDIDRVTVCPGEVVESAPMLVLGPGTGLGAAALVIGPGENPVVVSTEAGHMGFAPGTPLEIKILENIMEKNSHVSVENLISGRGMPVLYQSIAGLRGRAVEMLSAQQITDRALAETDENCRATLSVFCAVLGSFAGDLALCFGARGGVFLGGGMLPKLGAFLPRTEFAVRFRSKGVMSRVLNDVPVFLVTSEAASLLGSSYWYRKKYGLSLDPATRPRA